MARVTVWFAVAALSGCGASAPPRTPGGLQPEAEGVCNHDGKVMLLSKWPGGSCGTNPASPPSEPIPTCQALASTLGCA